MLVNNSGEDTVVGWLLIAFMAIVFFIPTVIAAKRYHNHPVWLFTFNVFSGLTAVFGSLVVAMVFWIILLVWSFAKTDEQKEEEIRLLVAAELKKAEDKEGESSEELKQE